MRIKTKNPRVTQNLPQIPKFENVIRSECESNCLIVCLRRYLASKHFNSKLVLIMTRQQKRNQSLFDLNLEISQQKIMLGNTQSQHICRSQQNLTNDSVRLKIFWSRNGRSKDERMISFWYSNKLMLKVLNECYVRMLW